MASLKKLSEKIKLKITDLKKAPITQNNIRDDETELQLATTHYRAPFMSGRGASQFTLDQYTGISASRSAQQLASTSNVYTSVDAKLKDSLAPLIERWAQYDDLLTNIIQGHKYLQHSAGKANRPTATL